MTALIIIFIVVAILMGMLCSFVVARDVVIEEKERRQKKNNPESVAQEQQLVVQPAPVVIAEQPAIEETAAAAEETAAEAGITEPTVAFSTATQTLEEKYLELSPEYKGYYDEIVKCAMAVEGSKRFKNESYEEYKVGKNRLVRLKIKRGVVVAELTISNLTFKNYISDNKVSVKQAPAQIKVVDEAALSAVKDSIGIAVNAFNEERAYKKEQAKLRRKQKRAEARESAEPVTAE